MDLHFIQHVPSEGLGSIAHWARKKGINLASTRLYQNEPLPELNCFDWLVIMGGPMNVYEDKKYPWLKDEKRLIELSIKNNKIVIGICLGAQLIADVLGASVSKNKEKEIGWFPVSLTKAAIDSTLFDSFPKEFIALHWHEDTFALPPGAKKIALSTGCENQGFTYNEERVMGLQFHLEFLFEQICSIIEGEETFKSGKYVQSPLDILSKKSNIKKTNQLMNVFLDNLYKYYSTVLFSQYQIKEN